MFLIKLILINMEYLKKNTMRILLLSFALILSCNVFSQNTSKTPFLRVFDLDGKKIAKGKLVQVTDSTLLLKKKKETIHISFQNIGFIKTKRSLGHKVGMGTVIGASTMATLFAISNSGSSSNFVSSSGASGLIVGSVVGAPSGALVGVISSIIKKPKMIQINGNKDQWQAFKDLFTQ